MGSRTRDVVWQETAAQLRQLLATERDDRRRARLRALLRLRENAELATVAAELGVSPRTIQRWLALYRGDGLAAVLQGVPGHRSNGRPALLTVNQRAQFAHHLHAGGFASVREAQRWVETTWGVTFTYQGMRSLMRRLRQETRGPDVEIKPPD